MKFKSCIFYLLLGFLSVFTSATSAQSRSLVVAALGDSITAGLMRDSSGRVSCPHIVDCVGNGAINLGGFAPFLASKLTTSGFSTNVINWGYAGERSNQLANRVSTVIVNSSPSHITIMAGANDAIDNVSRATVKFNIEFMARNAISKNVTPILATVTPDPRLLIYEANINKYNADIRELAEMLELPLADQFKKMNENFSAYNSGDLKHFNNLGNEKMAEEWFDAFIALLELQFPPEEKVNLNPILNLLL